MDHFNLKYKHLGATGAKSGEPVLIVHHDSGHGAHFHVQMNKAHMVIGLEEKIKYAESSVA